MKIILSIIRRLTFALVILPLIGSAAHFGSGENEADINADSFEMLKGGVVKAIGNVVLKYDGVKMTADEIIYDRNSRIVESPGWTRVIYKSYELNGQKVIYNLSTQAGQFENVGNQ